MSSGLRGDGMRQMDIKDIKPYKYNPRNNEATVEELAESIRQFGFLQPVVVDKNNEVIVGHTRLEAAKLLGYKSVPVIKADNLTEEQVIAYRIADNKIGEKSKWDKKLLEKELQKINPDSFDFSMDLKALGIDFKETLKRESWKKVERCCELKANISLHNRSHNFCVNFFQTGKTGQTLEEIKENPDNVKLFADVLTDYVLNTIGYCEGWCIVTTPRRRHAEGFHFATEICRTAADNLGIVFYENAITCKSRHRINPEFTLDILPKEKCVILYDDIITTGETLRAARKLLIDNKYSVIEIVGIRNKR